MIKTTAYHLVSLLLAASAAYAQSTFGAVVGTVTDSQQGVIVGAVVRLTEVQTNIARSTVSTNLGAYEFVNLNQGVYRLEIVKDGFGAFATQNFEVAARQTVRIDAELRPANIRQTTTVRDFAPLV